MSNRVEKWISEMTLEEKASLCSGQSVWEFQGIERLGIPPVRVSDGPHGLRVLDLSDSTLQKERSKPATCFPTASALACSFDRDLIKEVGVALAKECKHFSVDILLGCGTNIKRSPLCGRNFEYFSEDPMLAGEMSAAYIQGLQSEGVGASLKHFACNNQEKRRHSVSAVVDDRALREIYLAPFERAVKKAQPYTVMCSYNRINGMYSSENEKLLNGILKEEWGHEGIVISDWGAVHDRVKGVKATLDVEMPSSQGVNDRKIVAAVKDGSLCESVLDAACRRILSVVERCMATEKGMPCDMDAHHALARKVAQKTCVLMKNDGILPLEKKEGIVVLGELAMHPRYQGTGSSIVNANVVETAIESLTQKGVEIRFASGYDIETDIVDGEKLLEAVSLAKTAECVLLYVGLTDLYEAEAYDRDHLNLPLNQLKLVEEVLRVNKNCVIVLATGAPVELPFAEDARAILNCYLSGEAGALAAADILFGEVNPSGRLSETYPIRLSDNPSYKNFPGDIRKVLYEESIFVGYRYYDTAKKEVLFPFGHGLSYTEFAYSDLKVEERTSLVDPLRVSFKVKNVGMRAGEEVTQIYVGFAGKSKTYRAEKELRAFERVSLLPGEEKEVVVELDKRDFSFWSIKDAGWKVESGLYQISIGASSRDLRLEGKVEILGDDDIRFFGNEESLKSYFHPDENEWNDDEFFFVCGKEVETRPIGRPFDRDSVVEEMKTTWIGRIIFKKLCEAAKRARPEINERVVLASVEEQTLGTLPVQSNGLFDDEGLDALLLALNGKVIRGGIRLMRAFKKIQKGMKR